MPWVGPQPGQYVDVYRDFVPSIPGGHDVRAKVWAESEPPVSTLIADSGWLNDLVQVTGGTHAPGVVREMPGHDPAISAGESVRFSVTATDSGGDLQKVKWFVNDAQEGETGMSGYNGGASWQYTFNEPGTFSVEAVAFDSNGNHSPWPPSPASWKVTVGNTCVPQLVSPEEGATLDNGRSDRLDDIVWDFDWSDCEGATEYHLYVKHSQARIPVIDLDGITTSRYRDVRPSSYIADANRFGWEWKVRAKVGDQWGEWSEIRSFDVELVNTDLPRH
jgi:hypothetical protein